MNWPRVVVQRDSDLAVDLLQQYYEIRENGTPCYTGSRFEAIAAFNGDPNSIGPADFVAVSTLSVNVPALAAIRLLRESTAHEISQLLKQIPQADIVHVDSELLAPGGAASSLWKLLRSGRDGVGPTTTSKLMAAKRPQLLPIWDNFVNKATGLPTNDYWREFQTVLLADDQMMWHWLGELRQQATDVPPDTSNLRILDVVLWMSVSTP